MDSINTYIVSAFNRRWNAQVGKRHPNLWYVISQLRKEESRAQLCAFVQQNPLNSLSQGRIRAADRGELFPVRRHKYRRLERRVAQLRSDYRMGVRDIEQYWRAVTHAIMEFV